MWTKPSLKHFFNNNFQNFSHHHLHASFKDFNQHVMKVETFSSYKIFHFYIFLLCKALPKFNQCVRICIISFNWKKEKSLHKNRGIVPGSKRVIHFSSFHFHEIIMWSISHASFSYNNVDMPKNKAFYNFFSSFLHASLSLSWFNNVG